MMSQCIIVDLIINPAFPYLGKVMDRNASNKFGMLENNISNTEMKFRLLFLAMQPFVLKE